MMWDFAEGNPLGDSSGELGCIVDGITKAFAKTFEFVSNKATGSAQQGMQGGRK